MTRTLDILAGRSALKRGVQHPAAAWLGRPFTGRRAQRLVIYYEPKSISFTQVFPFLFYADALKQRFDVQLRCYPNTRLVAGDMPRKDGADVVLLQTWFDITPDALQGVLKNLRKAHPSAQISFVDSFAHTDLRLAPVLEPEIAYYFKKSQFANDRDYFHPFRGDTNLTEFYGDLYGLEQDAVDWKIPQAILPKLRLSPNFFTAPRFLEEFATKPMPEWEGRSLDIQTRFGAKGSLWYQKMREDALAKTRAIKGLKLSPPDRVAYPHYMEEMRRSRICFSPHGYGELCWRDIEGILAGAVLVKPDMSHLNTLPDLYRADETYLSVKWDFSDLEEVVHRALADEDLCRSLTQAAYQTIADYVRDARFVDDVACLFESA